MVTIWVTVPDAFIRFSNSALAYAQVLGICVDNGHRTAAVGKFSREQDGRGGLAGATFRSCKNNSRHKSACRTTKVSVDGRENTPWLVEAQEDSESCLEASCRLSGARQPCDIRMDSLWIQKDPGC